jgi:hypothetical protein
MALKDAPQCEVIARSTGLRCKNPCAYGKKSCRMHGAQPPGREGGNPHASEQARANLTLLNSPENRRARSKRMKGNRFGLSHGLYSKRKFISQAERDFFDQNLADYRAAYPTLDTHADDALLQGAVYYLTLLNRATKATDESDTEANRSLVHTYLTKMSELFRQLGIRRDCRLEKADDAVTPQQWIAGLCEIARIAREAEAKAAATAEPAAETPLDESGTGPN